MKLWIIATIIALLVVAGIVVSVTNVTTADEQETETIECSSCGNSCNAERNCGLQSCGAVSGGSCGCGR